MHVFRTSNLTPLNQKMVATQIPKLYVNPNRVSLDLPFLILKIHRSNSGNASRSMEPLRRWLASAYGSFWVWGFGPQVTLSGSTHSEMHLHAFVDLRDH